MCEKDQRCYRGSGVEERGAYLGDGKSITTFRKGQEDAGRLLQNREACAQNGFMHTRCKADVVLLKLQLENSIMRALFTSKFGGLLKKTKTRPLSASILVPKIATPRFPTDATVT